MILAKTCQTVHFGYVPLYLPSPFNSILTYVEMNLNYSGAINIHDIGPIEDEAHCHTRDHEQALDSDTSFLHTRGLMLGCSF